MSGTRYGRHLGGVALLLLLAVFALSAGCSSANTSGTADAPSPNHVGASGKSVPGWLALPSGGDHAASATLNYAASGGMSACVECHGADLTGGISRVSCFDCHHVSGSWAAPQEHGATAKQGTDYPGFVSCQVCHGENFSGNGSSVSCFPCHGVAAPHPAAPWRGSTFTHADVAPANAAVCAACHANSGAPAGTPPGCFNNTLCHGESPLPHPVGPAWVATPPMAQPHGDAAKAAASSTTGFAYCQICHGSGTNFAGGSSRVSCITCHSAPHGPAPWRTSAGSTYTHTNTAEPGNAAVCAFCHTNPSGPAGTSPGCFNNTLCHGSVVHSVPFNDEAHYSVNESTFTASCGSCHDHSAPSTKSGSPCGTCHAAGSPLTVLNCTSCHASPPDGNPPAGAAYPNIPGTHTAHAALGTSGGPIACNACHDGLGSRTLSHYNSAASRSTPGDVAFQAVYNAKTGAASFDNSALTCSNASCHGGQTTPNWSTGVIDVNAQCESCHALGTLQHNGYFSGDHAEHVEAPSITCSDCHNTAALAANHFTALDTPAMEGPASATVGGAGTRVATYDPGSGSCSPTAGPGCHGPRTW